MRWIAALLSALILALAHWALRAPRHLPRERTGEGRAERLVGRARAVDGDTLVLDGRRIRLLGLDAPELHQVCQADGREVACGAEALNALAALLDGRVRCEGTARDRYHRLLAHCRTAKSDEDVGEALVRAGQAINLEGYAAAEAEARKAMRGIWRGPFEEPARWRREGRLGGDRAEDEDRPDGIDPW